ncbi:MAG: hypothetical protein BGO10_03005 [Chlamydia sp. 32-24]|nr:MAG: hypothetical protein BGO10_03005 [Chlamydia sp. 32-24]
MIRRTKRHIVLLEVLIAFALIVTCILPLISTHVQLVKMQKELLNEIELDHVSNLFYGYLSYQLYNQAIPIENILQRKKVALNVEQLKQWLGAKSINFPSNYNAYYQFDYKRKPKNEAPSYAYLIKVQFIYENPTKNKTIDYFFENVMLHHSKISI